MKITKKAAIVALSIVATACAAVALAACDKVIELEELQKPKNVKMDSEVLTWDKVENADKYVLDFNGEEYTTTTESFDLFDKILTPAKYNIKIKAVGDEKKYYDSDWAGYGYTLNATSLTVEDEKDEYITVSIKNLDNFRGKAVIPATYKKKPVRLKLIGEGYENIEKFSGLTSLYIEDGGAFTALGGLHKFGNFTRIKLPSGFDRMSTMFQNCAKLKSLDIPSGLTSISSRAFSGCTALEKLSLPETVKKIGDDVIEGCDNLKVVTVAEANEIYKSVDNCVINKEDSSLVFNATNSPIAEGVKILSARSVYCSQGELKISASVSEIDYRAFYNVSKAPAIQIDENNQTFKCQDNCIIKKADNTYVKAFPNSVLPSDLTVIPENLFSYEKCLTEYTVPSTITEIGANSFYYCPNLKNVKFHNGVTKIGDNAFAASGLENLYLPSNIKEIGAGAFRGCEITSAILPESIEKIGEDAFFVKSDATSQSEDTTLYTSLEKLPDGIVRYAIGVRAIFFSCEIAGGDNPYVTSFTYKKDSLSGGNGLIPKREGYKFLGWTQQKDGTTAEYGTYDDVRIDIFEGTQNKTGNVHSLPTKDLVALNLGSMINDEQTNYVLYAVWKATK